MDHRHFEKGIGYKGLVASDDMEMGAVLKFAPIEETVVQHIRAGGDLALICHSEELITRGYEALVRAAETDARFRDRVAESERRVRALKVKLAGSPRKAASPSQQKVERLSRALWEFGEEVRLAALSPSQVSSQKPRANLGHNAERRSAERHSARRKTAPNKAERP